MVATNLDSLGWNSKRPHDDDLMPTEQRPTAAEEGPPLLVAGSPPLLGWEMLLPPQPPASLSPPVHQPSSLPSLVLSTLPFVHLARE